MKTKNIIILSGSVLALGAVVFFLVKKNRDKQDIMPGASPISGGITTPSTPTTTTSSSGGVVSGIIDTVSDTISGTTTSKTNTGNYKDAFEAFFKALGSTKEQGIATIKNFLANTKMTITQKIQVPIDLYNSGQLTKEQGSLLVQFTKDYNNNPYGAESFIKSL
jgi:hypothetical protein